MSKKTIIVCAGKPCKHKGSLEVAEALSQACAQQASAQDVEIIVTTEACAGPCSIGPVVRIPEDDIIYFRVKPSDAEALINSIGKKPVQRLLFRKNIHTRYRHQSEIPFFSMQNKQLPEDSEDIRLNPEKLPDYASAIPDELSTIPVYLDGTVKMGGLLELPCATTLHSLIYEAGAGITDNRPFKAVHINPPLGICLSEQMIHATLEECAQLISGFTKNPCKALHITVHDDRTCIPQLVHKCYIKAKSNREDISPSLKNILSGQSSNTTLNHLAHLCEEQDSADPSLSLLSTSLKYFSEEYRSHITNRYCPAGTCRALTRFYIDEQACIKCGLCAQNCPRQCIADTIDTATADHVYSIQQSTCISCGTCRDICKNEAIAWTSK